MLVFTIRNAALIALVQVAIIVAGVLAAGLSHRLWASDETPLPGTTLLLINYGVIFLAVPILWILAVLSLRGSARLSDEVKGVGFLTGFVLILGFLILIGHAVLAPWLHHNFPGTERAPEEVFRDTETATNP